MSKETPEAIEGTVLDNDFDLDLDESLPVVGEATRSSVIVKVQGQSLVMPFISEWPLDAIRLASPRAAADGTVLPPDLLGSLELIFQGSPDDLSVLGKIKLSQAERIFDHLNKVSGVTPGESSGSASSSRSTPARSSRT